MTVGERVTLHVEKPAAGGRMIARHGGAVVLVSGAIPGEDVEAEIEKVQRGTAWARTRRVLRPSADRVEPDGDWTCGGSVYVHVRYARQLELKRDIIRDAFGRIGRMPLAMDIDVASSPVDGYRMRARLHRAGRRLGFFREGTHQLCDPAVTRQLLPAAIEALRALEDALATPRASSVREVEFAENCPGDERAVHLIVHEGADPSPLGGLDPVRGLDGIWYGTEQGRAVVLHGRTSVSDLLPVSHGADERHVGLTRQAHAFFQGNRFLLAPLVKAVADVVPRDRVLDLYAGVGLFSVTLAARGDTRVTAIEGDRTSAADLKANASQCDGAVDPRHQPVEVFLRTATPGAFATVIVDPPRTGMTKEALSGAVALQAPRIVYVSCDVATLARDARMLVDVGHRLTSVRAFDLFPNTAHVETLAVFDRT